MKKEQNIILSCIDYTVSQEKFDLILDKDLEMLITYPQPKEEDLARYYESEDYISHTDSRKSLFDRVYQIVKYYTINRKHKLIQSLGVDNNNLLDIGCGTGDFIAVCKKNDWVVVGVEPNKQANQLARLKANQPILKSIKEVKNKKFNMITMWHVLEHVPNLKNYIKELNDLLETNGYLIIAVPNFKSYDAEHYGKYWAAYDVPRHLWHFSQKSIKELFSEFNIYIDAIKPMVFDSFYVSLLSEKNKTGFSHPISAFYTGLKSNLKAKRTGEYSSLIYILKKR